MNKNYKLERLSSSKNGYRVYSAATGAFVDYIHKDLDNYGAGPVITRWVTYDESGNVARRFVGKLGDFAASVVARAAAKAQEAK